MNDPWHLPGKNAYIYPYLCCASGALLGWLLSKVSSQGVRSARFESLVVGAFGAAIGGILMVTLITGTPADTMVFSIGRFASGLLGAAALLGVLTFFRRRVGPQHTPAARRHRFYE